MRNACKQTLEMTALLVVFAFVVLANYLVFFWVPMERTMGAVQRIFYFHVGSALASYCSFAVVFFSSIAYVIRRSRRFDTVSESAGEVGFVFCTIVLGSGMIWGHAAWNTWFNWEPRLVSFLILWLIFLAFNLLRVFGDAQKIAGHSAVLGILGGITIPIVALSVRFLPQMSQLHPRVIETGGLPPTMLKALLISIFAVVGLQFLILWIRIRIGLLLRCK